MNCQASYDVYMVTEKVWNQAGLYYDDNVCMACLEEFLQRPLVAEDFTNCLANWASVPQFFQNVDMEAYHAGDDERFRAALERYARRRYRPTSESFPTR